MSRQIFVNLPVRDLPRAKEFYTALGFACNPQFTNEQAACIVISEQIHVMLLTEAYFSTFTPRALADARQATEVLLCLSCDSRDEVDDLVRRAVAAGGTVPREPQDYGFMYNQALADLDGHIWELAHMDMSRMPAQP